MNHHQNHSDRNTFYDDYGYKRPDQLEVKS